MSTEKSTYFNISVDAVFKRISELYGLETDAAIGRKLGGMSHQSVYTYRKRGNVPYSHIIENCPPSDWVYILTGEYPKPPMTTHDAIDFLLREGFAVTLEKRD